MIAAIYIEKFEDLIDEPQTINLGGKYLYTFEKQDDDTIIVTRKVNEQYVEGFFDISDSSCKVDLVSAIVGENGVGKTTIISTFDSINIYNESYNIIFLNEDEHYNPYIIYQPKYIIESKDNKWVLSKKDSYYPMDNTISCNPPFIYYQPKLNLYQKKQNANTDIINQIFLSQLDFLISRIALEQKENILLPIYKYINITLDYFYKSQNNYEYFFEKDILKNIDIKKYFSLVIISYIKYNYGIVFSKNELEQNNEELLLILYSKIPKTCPKYDENINDLKLRMENLFKILFNKEYFRNIECDPVVSEYNLQQYVIKNILISDFLELYRSYKSIKEVIHHLYCKEKATEGKIDFLKIEPKYELSSGEENILNFYNNFNKQPFRFGSNIILLLDEVDLGYHPKWKKKFVNNILNSLPYFFDKKYIRDNSFNSKYSIQIIFTTHDPLTLSDMPNNNVVFLKKNENGKTIVLNNEDKARPRKTFGANITDILSNAFFVEDGLIGDFAKHKIEEVIKWIDEQKKDKSKNFDSELAHNKKVVALIDEPVIRRKLTEMITDLAPDNKYYNDAIEAQIKYLQSLKK